MLPYNNIPNMQGQYTGYSTNRQAVYNQGAQFLHMYNQTFNLNRVRDQRTFQQQRSPNRSPNRGRNNIDSSYNPDPNLPEYDGPYPKHELHRARNTLINSIKYDPSDILQRVKPRIGISSCYGKAHNMIPPKLENPSGMNETKNIPAAAGREIPGIDRQDSYNAINSDPQNMSITESKESYESPQRGTGKHNCSGSITIESSPSSSSMQGSTSSNSLKRKSDGDIFDITPKKTVTATAAHGEGHEYTRVYKCDFCNYQGNYLSVMESHIQVSKHFSASLYNASEEGLVSVQKKMAVKNKQMKNEALAVVCPECNDLFEDIFMCGVHYKYAHGGEPNEGFYSICPVVYQTDFPVLPTPICRYCNMDFEKHKLLHRHWEQEPSHHPLFRCTRDEKSFALYTCVHCNTSFYENFLGCRAHILNHYGSKSYSGQSLSMKVRHITKPTVPIEVLPLAEGVSQDGFDDELQMLQNMKAHFQSMSGTKSKVAKINERIKKLKTFRSPNLR